MITTKFLRNTRFPRFYSQFAFSTRPSVIRSPTPISRPSRLAKPVYIPPHFGNTITTFSTIIVPSKCGPTIDTGLNAADRLEALLKKDGFKNGAL